MSHRPIGRRVTSFEDQPSHRRQPRRRSQITLPTIEGQVYTAWWDEGRLRIDNAGTWTPDVARKLAIFIFRSLDRARRRGVPA